MFWMQKNNNFHLFAFIVLQCTCMAKAFIKGSDKPAHLPSLARLAARIHKVST